MNEIDWQYFNLNEIFEVEYGNKFDLNKMEEDGDSEIAFVSRSAKNNGVSAKVKKVDGIVPYEKGCLTVALGGSIGSTFIQETVFYTGQNVAVLKPKEKLSTFVKLFIATIIKLESDTRFVAFGRELNTHIKTDFGIKLPVKNDKPDFEFIENHMSSIYKKIAPSIKRLSVKQKQFLKNNLVKLSAIKNNENVRLDSIFEIKNGVASSKVNRVEQRSSDFPVPYIRPSKSQFSSIDMFINPIEDGVENFVFSKETLYVSTNGEGSHSYSYVSTEEFVPNSDVSVLIPKEKMDLDTKLLYAMIITYNRFRFSYGRKPKGEMLASLQVPKI
jgi:hypothetical protein